MSDDSEEIILDIKPSFMRRWLAIVALLVLAGILLSLAIGDIPGAMRVIIVALGVGVLWSANTLRIATMDGLVLTRAGLSTTSGRMLAPVENIERVERGLFAFKPSNGFLIRLKEAKGKGWAPGLWWQYGKRIGVGGTLSGGQTRAMADLLAMQVLEQTGGKKG